MTEREQIGGLELAFEEPEPVMPPATAVIAPPTKFVRELQCGRIRQSESEEVRVRLAVYLDGTWVEVRAFRRVAMSWKTAGSSLRIKAEEIPELRSYLNNALEILRQQGTPK